MSQGTDSTESEANVCDEAEPVYTYDQPKAVDLPCGHSRHRCTIWHDGDALVFECAEPGCEATWFYGEDLPE